MTSTVRSRHQPPARGTGGGEPPLVVFSHLRWDWVWQRPQQLVSRFARRRRTVFVQEPRRADVATPTLRRQDADGVHLIWMDVPADWIGDEFGDPGCEGYADLLTAAIGAEAAGADCWLYTPTALHLAEALRPRQLVYDVMDDLSAFADGGAVMRARQHRALERADLVFTGGRSLHRCATAVRGFDRTYLFPSGVDTSHYARSRALRRPHGRPVAGYVGVLDERLDQPLVRELAAALPDWDIHLVGPVIKIDPTALPSAPNVHYPGMQPYDRLPSVMGGFDVALMPFALNEATRSISPTKTLEYLAAGLPVVSTRVPDVVADWGAVVRFADDGAGFAAGCRAVRHDPVQARDERLAPLRRRYEWDAIVGHMADLMGAAVAPGRPAQAPA